MNIPNTRGTVYRAFALLLTVAGLALAAQPAWRAARRTGLQCYSRHTWQRAQQRPTLSTPGAPALWLKIDSSGIDTLVVQDATVGNLQRFPCLVTDPDLPMVIMAHRDTHFRGLRKVGPGTPLSICDLANKVSHYTIVETEVLAPELIENRLRDRQEDGWLALVTCYPFRYTGPAPQRFLAWAEPERFSKSGGE